MQNSFSGDHNTAIGEDALSNNNGGGYNTAEERNPYSIRYDAVNAMLLNEFLKEHRTVQELKKEVAALTVGLQKVSAQLKASKPAPQVVENNR